MLSYPLQLSFRHLTIGTQIRVADSTGRMVAYVKQKALRLKEDVSVFADEGQQQLLYRIRADRMMDFNASYSITDGSGMVVGAVRRRGGRSIWRASYTLVDASGMEVGQVREENPWVKVADNLVGEVPIVGIFTGFLFNPAYLIDLRGSTVLRLKKRAAFMEGRFEVEQRAAVSDADEALLIPSLIVTVLLERRRG